MAVINFMVIFADKTQLKEGREVHTFYRPFPVSTKKIAEEEFFKFVECDDTKHLNGILRNNVEIVEIYDSLIGSNQNNNDGILDW